MIKAIKLRLFIALFCITPFVGFGDDRGQLLKADSLFMDQQYTQAFDLYQMLFEEDNVSSSMLLKMAFIQDASDNYSEALYFLNLYYENSADRSAIGKIEELAQANGLTGYRYNDSHYFLALLNKYKLHLASLLFSLVILLMAYSFSKYRKGEHSYVAFIFQIFITALLLFFINFNPTQKAIITSDQTLLRSGPSAGAEPVMIIGKGHRVNVLRQDEIWTKIEWDGDETYVRNDRLRII